MDANSNNAQQALVYGDFPGPEATIMTHKTRNLRSTDVFRWTSGHTMLMEAYIESKSLTVADLKTTDHSQLLKDLGFGIYKDLKTVYGTMVMDIILPKVINKLRNLIVSLNRASTTASAAQSPSITHQYFFRSKDITQTAPPQVLTQAAASAQVQDQRLVAPAAQISIPAAISVARQSPTSALNLVLETAGESKINTGNKTQGDVGWSSGYTLNQLEQKGEKNFRATELSITVPTPRMLPALTPDLAPTIVEVPRLRQVSFPVPSDIGSCHESRGKGRSSEPYYYEENTPPVRVRNPFNMPVSNDQELDVLFQKTSINVGPTHATVESASPSLASSPRPQITHPKSDPPHYVANAYNSRPNSPLPTPDHQPKHPDISVIDQGLRTFLTRFKHDMALCDAALLSTQNLYRRKHDEMISTLVQAEQSVVQAIEEYRQKLSVWIEAIEFSV